MKRPRDCGIYQILNTVNGKTYIGSAVHLRRRWNDHQWMLLRGIHNNRHLQSAWVKYGKDAFQFLILERISDEMHLVSREQFYLDQIRPYDPSIGYNISPVAGSTLGVPCSPEKAAKIGLANKGRKQTPEHIHAKSPWGRVQTEETRRILREKMLEIGHKPSADAIAKAAAANTGRPGSPKQIAAVKARSNSPEHHAHLRALNDKTRGKSTILTEEQIEQILAERVAGATYVDLGKKYGVSDMCIRNWCIRKGVSVATKRAAPPISPEPVPEPAAESDSNQLSLL